ncbi:phosphoheptose isomerase [Clostridium tepidiprofundi DSM 19306]|uniref:Phosphoheptose isomerase n=1 Tax=Clostridium tepidiprofundi DSM 19306 TaxID=1121338 RepID=A0A151B3G9_9CLOT|nr:D-sedoheptulose 7-phosphate isomerase [Clostridium tepidiprofundi]KYH34468.1 phosphoheptose isomerase [Clostridium tepidiprofundi DSM 19306]
MKEYIKNQVRNSYMIKQGIYNDDRIISLIENIALKAIDVYKNGNKILIAGNGGSAADAQHLAGEIVSKFYFDRPALPAIAVTTDTSIITSIGNDYGYDRLFERQIQANGVKGDMFIGISTSGNSENILRAFMECKRMGIITVGFTGETGGKMESLCDYCIKVPSNETPRIQEAHIMIGHILCGIIEKEIFKGEN